MTNIITAIVTAYCACTNCCGPDASGITADGHKAKQGITVAAPRSVPFGSKVVINGHTYVAQDRTAKRFDGRFDIFMSDHKKALRFGKKKVKVTVISK